MHRLRRRQSRKTSQLSWSSSNDSMVALPFNPSTSTMSFRGSRNTGFPESFDGDRNTCLPHPDAIIAPDATLTEADITFARATARHRKSLQVRPDPVPLHHHPVVDATYCASPTTLTHSATSSTSGSPAVRGADNTDSAAHSKDADSLHSGGSLSPTHARPPSRGEEEAAGRRKGRRRSLFARLTHR